ncbi:protein of unknown function [Paraburkholderia kururiensis]
MPVAALPPAWESSLWTRSLLLNDFFELRFSAFVISLMPGHTTRHIARPAARGTFRGYEAAYPGAQGKSSAPI